MDLTYYFITPFVDYIFMQRALIACVVISLTAAPLGVFLILRRMSLMGEALSHAILPGLGFAFLIWGMWLPGMTLGGTVTGLCVALFSGWIARQTKIQHDAALASFYLVPLALGVLLLSMKGGQMHVMHLLFGSILAIDANALMFMISISVGSLVLIGFFYRGLVYECFDPVYAQSVGISARLMQNVFLSIVVCNLIAACQALGTLMALGVMIIPAASAGLLTHSLKRRILLSGFFSLSACIAGLLVSYHANLPTGPVIVLSCGVIYMLCLVLSIFPQIFGSSALLFRDTSNYD